MALTAAAADSQGVSSPTSPRCTFFNSLRALGAMIVLAELCETRSSKFAAWAQKTINDYHSGLDQEPCMDDMQDALSVFIDDLEQLMSLANKQYKR
jgi:hypothetical protein